MDLEAIEMLVRGSMHRAGAEILGRLLSRCAQEIGETPCACGHVARHHDTRAKQLLTALGPAQFERAYYVCPHCQQGQSPRDRELDVEDTHYSPGVRRMMAVVGSESSFDQGREQLALLAGLEVNAKPSNARRRPSVSISKLAGRPRFGGPSNWSYRRSALLSTVSAWT